MAKTREIKTRLKAVANIKRITRTMQLIATAKFQTASRRMMQTRPYAEKIAEMVGELAAAAGDELTHPLLERPEAAMGKELLLVITSSRGLCGAYNGSVLRAASAYLAQRPGIDLELEVVGKKGVAFFRFAGANVTQAHTQLGDEPTYDQVEALAARYIERFSRRQVDAVHVAMMQFISSSQQVPRVMTLLPLEAPEAATAADWRLQTQAVYEFRPDPRRLLDELLPAAVKTQLFRYFNKAAVSEHVARMVAMKAATDNAEQMGKTLTRQYNRARQTQITTELTEVVTGAAALE